MAEAVDTLSAVQFYEALGDAARVVADHAAALDELDGHGVGSDMAATLSGAIAAVENPRDLATVSAQLTAGARQAAVGVSGRQLARVLEGMGETLRNADVVDAERFSLALEAAAELLAQSHDGRRPGRFAAVISEAADAALASSDGGATLADTVIAAASAGIEELEKGPESDPRLAERGTVDPGGAGLLLVLDSLASVVAGEPLPQRPPARNQVPTSGSGSPSPSYDLSCRVIPDDGGPEVAASLQEVLAELGEITLWNTGTDTWSVALVTPLPGAAVEAIVEVGRPSEVRIAVSDTTPDVAAGTPSGNRGVAGSPAGAAR